MIRYMSHFSEKLNTFLGSLGWTAYKMADASGMNTQYVYKLTGGQRTPEDETLERIATIPDFQNNGITLEVLKSWRAVDRAEEIKKKYDEQAITEAFRSIASPEVLTAIEEVGNKEFHKLIKKETKRRESFKKTKEN